MKQKDERQTHASRWATNSGMGKKNRTYDGNGNERKMCGRANNEKQIDNENEVKGRNSNVGAIRINKSLDLHRFQKWKQI